MSRLPFTGECRCLRALCALARAEGVKTIFKKYSSFMATVKKVLVYLFRDKLLPQCAKFVQSVTGHFDSGLEDNVLVNCGIDQNRLLISDQEFAGSSRVLLKRPKLCPMKNLEEVQVASFPEEIQNRGVEVAVAVILQTVDWKVLLTRRAKRLYKFPNIWVPPSGHIELDEQVLDAGLRELEEETGLRLKEGEFTWKILCLWESVFPAELSQGHPTRHHVVIFILVMSPETHHQLQERLAPDESEVSACMWLDPAMTELILSVNRAPQSIKGIPDIPETIRVLELRSGSLVQVDLPSSAFLNNVPSEGADAETVCTGTKFGLRLWLDTLSQDK